MKKYKKYVPFLVLFIMFVSWYVIIDRNTETKGMYDTYVSAAEEAIRDDLPDVAMENIQEAWEMKQDPELVFKMADYLNQKKEYDAALDWCDRFFDDLKYEPKIYEYLANGYIQLSQYSDAIAIMETAKEASLDSDILNQSYNDIKYRYTEKIVNAQVVYPEWGGYCIFKQDERYGVLSDEGEIVIPAVYRSMGAMLPVGEETLCPVIDEDGKAWLVDDNGTKRCNISMQINNKSIQIFGVGSYYGGVMPIWDESGKYSLLNMKSYDLVLEGYDYIGSCISDRIAVKKDGKWFVVNSKGEPVSEERFSEIKVDEYGFAFTGGVAFAKSGNQYILIDKESKRIGDQGWEDAIPFQSNRGFAPVQVDGHWDYVDVSGTTVLKNFDAGEAFGYGFAAACKNGKWSFINKQGENIVDYSFDGAVGFTSPNTALAQIGDQYVFLKFNLSSTLG